MKHALRRPKASNVIPVLVSVVLAAIAVAIPAAFAATTTYQAETAALSGGASVATDHTGYTGTGFVGGYVDANRGLAQTRFTVNANAAGDYAIALRYANGTGSARTLSVYVNGAKLRQTTLGATANWDSWMTKSEAATLRAGSNTVDYRYDSTDNGNVNIDNIAVTDPVPPPPGSGEAESAALSGGAVVQTDHAGFTGTGFVGGYTDANRGLAATTFTFSAATAGTHSATLRYANGTGAARTLSLYSNGTKLRQINLPATANWDTWATAAEDVTLNAGSNTLAYRFDTADSGNVNLDSLVVLKTTPPPPPIEGSTIVGPGGKCVDVAGSDTGVNNAAVQLWDCQSTAVDQHWTLTNGALRTLGRCLAIVGTSTASGAQAELFDCTGASAQQWTPQADGTLKHTTSGRCLTSPGGTTANGTRLTITDCAGAAAQMFASAGFPPVDSGGGATYQAEAAFFSGGPSTASSIAGSSGGSYLTGSTAVGARVIFTVNSSGNAATSVQLRYANAQSSTISVYVNGAKVKTLTLASSGNTWTTSGDSLTLRTGLNTVTYQVDSGNTGSVNIDYLSLPSGPVMAARGATTPYQELEAESGSTNGAALGPDRTYLSIASESSGRRAVRLGANGQYVQFTLTKPANSVVIRYSVPDTGTGADDTPTLGLYINGTRSSSVPMTNRYSWVYGGYPYSNPPSGGQGHHFYDEVRVRTAGLAAGTVVKLQKDSADTAASYVIDLVDFEQVDAAYAMPAGFVSITSHGGTANGGGDDTAALNNAIAAARSQGSGVWIPAGEFEIRSRINVDNVMIRGAGPWYSVLRGYAGKGGFFATGSNVRILDLAIFGEATYRDDANFDAALEGNFGTGSLVQNVWMEHVKVGMWIDSGTNGLYVGGVRIRDTWADGVNIHANVQNTQLMQSVIRNTGDDGLAMWSGGGAVTNSAFRFNTVQSPVLANTIGIYGGNGNRVEDNIVSDTVVAGSGIAISSRFSPVPFSGTTSVLRNTLNRTGSLEINWNSKLGALWVYADTSDITAPVVVMDNEILDSTYSGILISFNKTITNLTVDRMRIDRAGEYGIEVQSMGWGSFSNVTVTNAVRGGLLNNGGFDLRRGAGNSGF